MATVKPNPGHLALAQLEERWGDRFTLVTQNVDGLHRAAGSRNVLEIHGSLYRTRCLGCDEVKDRGLEPLGDLPVLRVRRASAARHRLVRRGAAGRRLGGRGARPPTSATCLLVVGTSAVVHPAASLVPIAKRHSSPSAKVIEVNLTRTEASALADVGLYGPSGVVLPKLVEKLG